MTKSLNDPDEWALLAKYLAGDATSLERARIERWLAADAKRRAIIEELRLAELRLVALDSAALAEPVDAAAERAAEDAGWNRLDAAIRPSRVERRQLRGIRASARAPRHTLSWSAVAIAATLLIGLAVGRYAMQARTSWRTYAASAGERETVTLADGTQFTLAPESRLRVPSDYADGDRAVVLDGEAFFAVVHDAAHPFRVRSGNVVTSDIGTSFDVRAYNGERTLRVGVAEGRVALSVGPGAALRALSPGDLATIDVSGATTIARGVDADAYLAWTRGTLVFHRAPLATALAEITRWYGVTFTPVDPVFGKVELTATYERESLDEVLDQIGRVIGARVERRERTVTLVPTKQIMP